jgi:hypothetical protein
MAWQQTQVIKSLNDDDSDTYTLHSQAILFVTARRIFISYLFFFQKEIHWTKTSQIETNKEG